MKVGCILDDDRTFFHNEYCKSNVWKKMSQLMPEKGVFPALKREEGERVSFDKYKVCMKNLSVENQYISGRCWIYAACHFLRHEYFERYKIDLLLSQEYIAFYDLLEKANEFINYIVEHISDSDQDRVILMKLKYPIQDAGQWDFFINIIEKYGVVPQKYMSKNIQSRSTVDIVTVLSTILRIAACNIRKEYNLNKKEVDLNYIKKKEMSKIYCFLCGTMGEPPELIEICVQSSKDKKEKMTPREFYHSFFPTQRIKDMVPITSLSGLGMQIDHVYEVDCLKNMTEGRSVRYLNVGRDEFKRLILAQLNKNMPIWFGCDSRYGIDMENGILDLNYYDTAQIGIHFPSKEESLLYNISELNHAMLFEGVRYDSDEQLTGWLVKNSYGSEKGNCGYLDMRDCWFDKFVYEAVIDRSLLSDSQIKIYESDVRLLPLWHPIGTLAD